MTPIISTPIAANGRPNDWVPEAGAKFEKKTTKKKTVASVESQKKTNATTTTTETNTTQSQTRSDSCGKRETQ